MRVVLYRLIDLYSLQICIDQGHLILKLVKCSIYITGILNPLRWITSQYIRQIKGIAFPTSALFLRFLYRIFCPFRQSFLNRFLLCTLGLDLFLFFFLFFLLFGFFLLLTCLLVNFVLCIVHNHTDNRLLCGIHDGFCLILCIHHSMVFILLL